MATPVGVLEVEGEAALVAVQVLEVGPVPRPAQPAVALGGFDLDHLGAPVGELAHRRGSGAHARQIEDLEAGERQLAHESSTIWVMRRGSNSSQAVSPDSKTSSGEVVTRKRTASARPTK